MALISAPDSFLSVMTQAEVTLPRVDFQTRSIFTKKRQVISYPSAALWRVSLATYPQTPAEAGAWRRFVMALRGRENWFQCPVPLYSGPATGYAGPAAQVDGAGQSGFSLNLKNITPSANYAAAGDIFTVADQCFVISADVTADGAGEAEITFDTPLHASPANNAALNLNTPYFLCASMTSDAAKWTGAPVNRSAFRFDGEEHR